MASTEVVTVSVGEVAAMSDAELAQFMQRHRLPNGDYDLPVDGWHRLSKDERGRLAERLEAQKRDLTQSPTACSRPLDLDDLDARLRQVSPNKSFSLRPEGQVIARPRSPTPPLDLTRLEIEAHRELLNDGARPLYPINLVQDVHEDPDNYAELLRPWQEHLTQICAEGIFQRQLQRWQDFRKWQNDNRGREDNDGGFPAYVQQRKRWIKEDYPDRVSAELLAEIEADPSRLKSDWDQAQFLRRRQRRLCRELGCKGFRDYAEAVKRRLARHGFTQLFELDEDPKQQDKLTTWIEYLNYEYWWLDKYTGDIERLEPEHDRLWQELVDEKILRPHETKDFVRTMASGYEREADKEQAMKAVQRAESEAKRIYILTQEDPERLRIPRAKRISMLKHGTERLLAARRRLEQAKSHSFLIIQFVRATFGYAGAKNDAVRHRILLQWVLDQVPLIEAEMNLSRERGRLGPGGRRATKRSLATDEELPERPTLKRVRFDLEEPRLASARVPSTATETQLELGIAMDQTASQGLQPDNLAAGCSHQDDVQALPQTPRRSSRIAAREDASGTALELHVSQLRSRSRLRATPAQPSSSYSPSEDTKVQTAMRQSRSKSQPEPNRRPQRRRQRRGG